MERKRGQSSSISGRRKVQKAGTATEEWQFTQPCSAIALQPFWVEFNQQLPADEALAAAEQPCYTDVSLGQWHTESKQVLSLSQWGGPSGRSCRHAIDADDAETEDTATSSSLETSSGAVSGKGLSDSDHSSGSPMQQGEDDSVTSTQPHRAASAAFSFTVVTVADTALELPWAGLGLAEDVGADQ